jgi:hypothetical protein
MPMRWRKFETHILRLSFKLAMDRHRQAASGHVLLSTTGLSLFLQGLLDDWTKGAIPHLHVDIDRRQLCGMHIADVQPNAAYEAFTTPMNVSLSRMTDRRPSAPAT